MARKKKEEEEEVYHVEVITKARVTEDGGWEYFVKWAGYDSDADSWEPSENVQQCDRLLTSFWKHVGMDNGDYPVAYEIAAEGEWIKKEKRYFEETYVKRSKRKKERQERLKSKSSTPRISENILGDSTSSDERPSVKTPTAKMANGKARAVDSESESESGSRSETESDGYLRKQAKVVSLPKAATPPSKEPPKVPVWAKRQEPRSETDASSSIPPPKPTVVRTHQDQRINPLVKPMDLPSKSFEAGSSLSTKQRIAAGIPPPPGPKPLPTQPKKSSLSLLSFRKNKPPPLPSNPAKDATATTATVATPTSPVARVADTSNEVEMVASPQPMDIDQPIDFFGSISDDGPIGGCPENFVVPTPPKSQEEINAERFLQTVDIPAELDIIPDQPEAPTLELTLTKTSVIPKIPKKWKWSGYLFISTTENKTELLCAVNIADPNGTSNSSHINLLLSPLDSLRISRLYPILLLSPLIRACGKPQYFGRLESNEPGDEAVIHGMEHHLTSEGLAAAVPLLLDDAEVAILVVFPKAQKGLTTALQVPECLLSDIPTDPARLLVVLLPLLVSAKTSTSVAGLRSIETVMQSSFNPLDAPVLPQEALLYQGMSLLCFPKTLLDFLNNPSTTRTYCIWPMPDQLSLGLDTAMLQYVLRSSKAASARLEEDIRAIFIPNSHLGMLHTMPSLVAKRVNCPEVQFWTYGFSANVACESWRLQEIYPLGMKSQFSIVVPLHLRCYLGGVVTFTSSALAEDLMGCYHLISQIIDHPLWDCYVIPEVLAVTQHLLCGNGDLTLSESCLGPILDFITDGLISVIRMPDEGHSSPIDWASQTFAHQDASGQELLELCFEILRGHLNILDMTTEQLITFTNDKVTRDLSNAQIQPTFMKNYRRFVVIRAASEDNIPFDKDGLEWISLPSFSFKDDYFQHAVCEMRQCAVLDSEKYYDKQHTLGWSATGAGVNIQRPLLSLSCSPIMSGLNDLVLNPALHDYLAIIKGARNGFIYGVKVRFPHALIMAILFGRGDWKTRCRVIYQATKQHALNLAKFVSLFKILMLLQRKANGGKERSTDTFVAGLIGGYVVFGDRSAVNEQIVLYVVSRVIASFLPRATAPYSKTPPPNGSTIARPIPPDSRYFSVFAALAWGAVMWVYRYRPQNVQPGMYNSMTYLYHDSEVWGSLRTLLWRNK
ncbi:hypothetical protein JVU11DRAFT_5373 [Chiua virens]|nr:hypothetical protein JVU11DRAFT_5373 [Chiua virens]